MTSPWIWMASQVWSAASAVQARGYRLGLFRAHRLTAKRVISVGNLQAGGSGKTPLAAQIAREAFARGLSVEILLRGYRGRWERDGGVIEPGQSGLRCDPDTAGDEACLLAELAPQAWIGVGCNRVKSDQRITDLRSGDPCDLAILDDGFQHLRVVRDLDVLAVTSDRATDRVFRDWKTQSTRAKLVVWTKGHEVPQGFEGGPPLVRAEAHPYLYKPALANHPEAPRWLLTSVGDSARTREQIEGVAGPISRHIRWEDHARFDVRLVRRLEADAWAQNAKLLMTGKDWVKWRKHAKRAERVEVYEVRYDFVEGANLWLQTLWPSQP